MMNIWMIISYMVLGVIGLGVIGYAFATNVLERHVGKDFMNKEEQCDQVFKDLDPKITTVQKKVGVPRMIVYVASTLLCWPISVPYMLHRINKYGEFLEEYIRYNGDE